MKIKTAELTGPALGLMVAHCQGLEVESIHPGQHVNVWKACPLTGDKEVAYAFRPDQDWSHAGPVIAQMEGLLIKHWLDSRPDLRYEVHIHSREADWIAFGPTLLVAAMRCRVGSKLGEVVDIPAELWPEGASELEGDQEEPCHARQAP